MWGTGNISKKPEGEILLLQYLHDKIGGYDLNVFATPVRAEDGSIRNVLFAASRTKDVADKLLMEIYDARASAPSGMRKEISSLIRTVKPPAGPYTSQAAELLR